MKRLVWLTDIHLNFLASEEIDSFLDTVRAAEPEAILLGGDIGEAHTVVPYLEQLAAAWDYPVYFVLGNHDFYFGSIREVRHQVSLLCRRTPNLVYLTEGELIHISNDCVLAGHDGWADARAGDYLRSLVMMYDYRLIDELRDYRKLDRWDALKRLGDEAAARTGELLDKALQDAKEVLFLTHVPPFREACWYNGSISNDEWAPHFSCLAMGRVILEMMHSRPRQRLTVLCGHTHGAGFAQPLPNVSVMTGGAEYGAPSITRVIELAPRL